MRLSRSTATLGQRSQPWRVLLTDPLPAPGLCVPLKLTAAAAALQLCRELKLHCSLMHQPNLFILKLLPAIARLEDTICAKKFWTLLCNDTVYLVEKSWLKVPLICCERKILFVGWKSMTYKTSQHPPNTFFFIKKIICPTTCRSDY
jgi:hypothetical protein